MNERPSYAKRLEAVPLALAAGLVVFAFGLAWQTTFDLEWPCEVDFFRDMGGAQAILDGYPGADPAYAGEFNWYNPLQPALFAALAALTGLPLHVLYARVGPFVNLLGPLGFYVLARQLLGRWGALAALGAYLFLGNPEVPSWFQATYSPWAWPMNFAQGFFYLTVAAYVRTVLTQRFRWDVVAGVLLGITFLAHTAPTLVFVVLLFFLTLFSARADRTRALGRLLVIGGVSLMVASPYLGPVLMHYRLHVLNPAPSEHEPISARFVLLQLLSFRTAVAGLGLTVLGIRRSPTTRRADTEEDRKSDVRRAMIFQGLLFAPTVLLGYGMLAQYLQHREIVKLPRALPTYHFHLYFKAAESLLFGVGLAAVAQWIGSRLRMSPTRAEGALLAVLALTVVGCFLPRYLEGIELNKFRQESQRIAAETERVALYRWLLAETRPTDVFLTDQGTSIWVVGAADRKVVSLPDQYSNIYVSYEERAADLDRLYDSLRNMDTAAFDALAAKYGVTYVIVKKNARRGLHRMFPDCLGPTRFTLVFDGGGYWAYRLK